MAKSGSESTFDEVTAFSKNMNVCDDFLTASPFLKLFKVRRISFVLLGRRLNPSDVANILRPNAG